MRGAGDGPKRSIRDERLFGQLGFGLAVLGAPGNVLQEMAGPDRCDDFTNPKDVMVYIVIARIKIGSSGS